MLHTVINIPRGILKEYILFVAIRKLDGHQAEILKPMHAKHEIHMMFMIGCKMHDFKNEPNYRPHYIIKKNTNPHCTFSGLLTSMKGSIVFKGQIKLLTIHFKPTGFYRLFNIRRFNTALDMKTYHPDLSWLNICYQAGYYDQMHLIKDFKAFAGLPPSVFYKNSPPLYEDISSEHK